MEVLTELRRLELCLTLCDVWPVLKVTVVRGSLDVGPKLHCIA